MFQSPTICSGSQTGVVESSEVSSEEKDKAAGGDEEMDGEDDTEMVLPAVSRTITDAKRNSARWLETPGRCALQCSMAGRLLKPLLRNALLSHHDYSSIPK